MLLHLVGGCQFGILNIQFKSLKKLKLPSFREKHGKAGALSSLKLIHGIIDKAYFCLDTFATLEGTEKSLRFIVCVKLACKSVRRVPKTPPRGKTLYHGKRRCRVAGRIFKRRAGNRLPQSKPLPPPRRHHYPLMCADVLCVF